MEKVTITEMKNRFSTFLDKVKHGDSVLITERGRPVACLESILTTASNDIEGRLMRLETVEILGYFCHCSVTGKGNQYGGHAIALP